jgi:hypothetical protein
MRMISSIRMLFTKPDVLWQVERWEHAFQSIGSPLVYSAYQSLNCVTSKQRKKRWSELSLVRWRQGGILGLERLEAHAQHTAGTQGAAPQTTKRSLLNENPWNECSPWRPKRTCTTSAPKRRPGRRAHGAKDSGFCVARGYLTSDVLMTCLFAILAIDYQPFRSSLSGGVSLCLYKQFSKQEKWCAM